MSRNRRRRRANSAAVAVLAAIMAGVAISALYSLVYLGDVPALWSEWNRYLAHAARYSSDPYRYWLWRVAQFTLLLAPLSLWFGWTALGRLLKNIQAIDAIEELRRHRREQRQAAELRRADCAAAARAREVATAKYPGHVSLDTLEGDDSWGDRELIADFLDPPEIAVRYTRQAVSSPGELYFYDRKRVEAAKTDRGYLKRIAEIRQRRWEEEARERREATRMRQKEELDRIEQQKRDELSRRQASQKIVYVS